MKVIDVNALPYQRRQYKKDGIVHYELAVTKHDIDNMPAVNAEPVRWTRFVECHDEAVMCLACGTILRGGNKELLNYCPHCGAKNGG